MIQKSLRIRTSCRIQIQIRTRGAPPKWSHHSPLLIIKEKNLHSFWTMTPRGWARTKRMGKDKKKRPTGQINQTKKKKMAAFKRQRTASTDHLRINWSTSATPCSAKNRPRWDHLAWGVPKHPTTFSCLTQYTQLKRIWSNRSHLIPLSLSRKYSRLKVSNYETSQDQHPRVLVPRLLRTIRLRRRRARRQPLGQGWGSIWAKGLFGSNRLMAMDRRRG